jgi:hypothetical protein
MAIGFKTPFMTIITYPLNGIQLDHDSEWSLIGLVIVVSVADYLIKSYFPNFSISNTLLIRSNNSLEFTCCIMRLVQPFCSVLSMKYGILHSSEISDSKFSLLFLSFFNYVENLMTIFSCRMF